MVDSDKNHTKNTEKLPETYIYRRISSPMQKLPNRQENKTMNHQPDKHHAIYRPIRMFWQFTQCTLAGFIVLTLFYLWLIYRAKMNHELPPELWFVLWLFWFFLGFVCMLAVGIWLCRSHENARALQIDGLTISPTWAILSVFVPIANIFVPYRAMKQLYSGSLNKAGISSPSTLLLWTWWGTSLIFYTCTFSVFILGLLLALLAWLDPAYIFAGFLMVWMFESVAHVSLLGRIEHLLDPAAFSWGGIVNLFLGCIAIMTLLLIMKSVQSAHAHIAHTLEK